MLKKDEKIRKILNNILTSHLDSEELGVTDDLGVIMKGDFNSIINEIMVLMEQIVVEEIYKYDEFSKEDDSRRKKSLLEQKQLMKDLAQN